MSVVRAANPYLAGMESDQMHHLGLHYEPEHKQEWIARFGDIKFFVCGGSNDRMKMFAKRVAEALHIEAPFGYELACIAGTSRYVVYKVGPVLVSSHGMGMPSISILLHEVVKLLDYAEATDVTFIRMGTSGGIGVDPGTVVVTSEAVNQKMEALHPVEMLDRVVMRPSPCTKEVAEGLHKAAGDLGMACAIGKTLSCDDFYEGQGRLDGALCEFTLEDKMKFLHYCNDHGVRNIEMEIRMLASFCHRLNISVGCVCVALLNRLNGDQVTSTHEELTDFENRAGSVVLQFIKNKLAEHA